MAQAIRSFRDLRTWQSAQELCLRAYTMTAVFPNSEQFGLTSQMRRAAVSVPSNIAEGFGRQTAKEKQQFYHHALGSLFELETQIDLSYRLGYTQTENFSQLNEELENCRKLLLALIRANKLKISHPKSSISNPL
jgi:four helix bundle protein